MSESIIMDDDTETDIVELPSDLIDRVGDRVQQTQFDDSTAYIRHVLEEVLWQLEHEDVGPEMGGVEGDESLVEDRLEALGYLNE